MLITYLFQKDGLGNVHVSIDTERLPVNLESPPPCWQPRGSTALGRTTRRNEGQDVLVYQSSLGVHTLLYQHLF